MKVKLIAAQPRKLQDPLYVVVDPGATLAVPDELGPGLLCQPWFWEAADEPARTLAAEHPEWWDHPYIAELAAAGTKVAAQPKAKSSSPPVQVDTSK